MFGIGGAASEESLAILARGSDARKENKQMEKTNTVYQSIQAESVNSEGRSNFLASRDVKDSRVVVKVFVVVAAVLIIGAIGTSIYLDAKEAPQAALQCRPTLFNSTQGQLGPMATLHLLQQQHNSSLIPAHVVEKQLWDEREEFDQQEKTAYKNWSNYNSTEKAETQAELAATSQNLGKNLVTCVTGQPYSTQSFHPTLASFMELPFTPSNEFGRLFITLRALNQNFSQPIDNPMFVEICDNFLANAKLRTEDEMLNEDGEWTREDFSAWITTIKNGLTAYIKAINHPFFKDLAPQVESALGAHPGFKELAVAPPRDQIVGLQQINTQCVAKLCAGHLNQEEKNEIQDLLYNTREDIPYLQYAALTGKSYYARLHQNPFKVVLFDECSVGMFKWLYWWAPGDSSEYQFKSLWNNYLQYWIDQGAVGFDQESVQNLIYALQSVAESRNGTPDFWDHETTVDMRPVLEVIREGVRFGNETWRPIRT